MSTLPKTALVLAGGGSCGAVHVGMLRALCAHGVQADLVAGPSVGAINGAFYAGAPDMKGIERLEALWRALKRPERRAGCRSSLRLCVKTIASSTALFTTPRRLGNNDASSAVRQ